MALTKLDLGKIGKLIDANYNLFNVQFDKLKNDLDLLKSTMNSRFDIVDKRLDQLSKTENENTLVLFGDVEKIRLRVKTIENKVFV